MKLKKCIIGRPGCLLCTSICKTIFKSIWFCKTDYYISIPHTPCETLRKIFNRGSMKFKQLSFNEQLLPLYEICTPCLILKGHLKLWHHPPFFSKTNQVFFFNTGTSRRYNIIGLQSACLIVKQFINKEIWIFVSFHLCWLHKMITTIEFSIIHHYSSLVKNSSTYDLLTD